MKSPRLLIFPALALLLLLLAWRLAAPDLRVWSAGGRAPGFVAALLLSRPGSHDVIQRIDADFTLRYADGTEARFSTRNSEIVALGDAAPPPDAAQLAGADAGAIRRFLQRSARAEAPGERVVRVEKIERARGWFKLPEAPASYAVDADGAVRPADSTTPPSVRGSRAIFSQENAERLAADRGDSLLEFAVEFDGVAQEHTGPRDFALFTEPRSTLRRPIFTYAAEGATHAMVADLGRYGGQSLAFPLFKPCRVAYVPGDPTRSLLLAEIGRPPAGLKALDWFSRACEAVLTRWVFPGLLALAAAIYLGVGAMLASLAWLPPKKVPEPPPGKA